MNKNENGGFLKISTVAYILNITRSYAYQLVQSGELPSHRVGKSLQVTQDDLDAFISSRRTSSCVPESDDIHDFSPLAIFS